MKHAVSGLMLVALLIAPFTLKAENGEWDKCMDRLVKSTKFEGPANYGALNLGYFMPNGDDEGKGMKNFNDTWDVELSYGRIVAKDIVNVAVEAGFTYYSTKNDGDNDLNIDSKVTTWSIPVTLKAIYPATKEIDVFAGIGGGYYSSEVEVGDASDTGTGAGYHALAGVDYLVMPNVKVGMEVKYDVAKVKNSDWEDKINVGGTSIKLGAKYMF